jgi:hypothetical protein
MERCKWRKAEIGKWDEDNEDIKGGKRGEVFSGEQRSWPKGSRCNFKKLGPRLPYQKA